MIHTQPRAPSMSLEGSPRERHPQIFAAFEALQPGAAFERLNDHDPKPLRYQFEAEHTGQFAWDDMEQGPDVWRVHIGRS